MAYILFLDESGQDRTSSPYEVTAGIAIEDRSIWNMIKAIHDLEIRYFGRRYSHGERELKARKLLKTKTFRLAKQLDPFSESDRRILAKACLDDGENINKAQLTALAQAKIAFSTELLRIAYGFRCKVFASIVSRAFNPLEKPEFLRKDYVYLLERYFYFLEDKPDSPPGLIVFDEIEKNQCWSLIQNIEDYFKKSDNGRLRSSLLIPEPLFVHSDLTTLIQIADLVAYVISWSLRLNGMNRPIREELLPMLDIIKLMRNRSTREIDGLGSMEVWSVTYLK